QLTVSRARARARALFVWAAAGIDRGSRRERGAPRVLAAPRTRTSRTSPDENTTSRSRRARGVARTPGLSAASEIARPAPHCAARAMHRKRGSRRTQIGRRAHVRGLEFARASARDARAETRARGERASLRIGDFP